MVGVSSFDRSRVFVMNEIEWIDDPMEASMVALKSNFLCYRTDEELKVLHQKVESILAESVTEMMSIELIPVDTD